MDRIDEVAEKIAARWIPASLPKTRKELRDEIAQAIRGEVEHARQAEAAQEG